MLHRRSTTTAALLLLAVPVGAALTSCGFDYPTDRVNQIGAGANNRDATVDVLGVRVVSTSAGAGRLIGTLANNTDEAAELTGVTSDGAVQAEVEGIEIAPESSVNLAGDDVQVPVTGEFTAGEVVTLTFEFDTDETVTLDVPVVKHCFQYSDVAEPSAAAGEAAAEGAEAEGAEAESTEGAEAEGESEADQTYLCDHPTEGAEGAEGGH